MRVFIVTLVVLLNLCVVAQDQSSLEILEDKIMAVKAQQDKWNTYLKSDQIAEYNKLTKKDIEKIIKTARSFLGTKHCMGGLTKKCIDCSGLLYVSFDKNGFKMPRDAEDISRYGKYVLESSDLQKGDLVFFMDTYKTEKFITHAGIYLGNNEFIHTSSSKGVMISKLMGSYYWESKYIFAKRLSKE
ncbi:MAG: C40 family peptidase [Flavobacteriales bacterium]|nr:C40 family peptidase [Flavobacteriales bacterium]